MPVKRKWPNFYRAWLLTKMAVRSVCDVCDTPFVTTIMIDDGAYGARVCINCLDSLMRELEDEYSEVGIDG